MAERDGRHPITPTGAPHSFDHQHSDVSGGWLRAATFGAMDGLVSNTALIAGVSAAASSQAVVISGIAGLLAGAFSMALSHDTAAKATEEIHQDEIRAVNFHLVQELGVDPSEKPSPWIAAISSFVMFAIGAVVPLIPYLLGYESLWAGVICGGIGLMIAGGVAARFTSRPIWWASLRQLVFGSVAIAATYVVGMLVDSLLRRAR